MFVEPMREPLGRREEMKIRKELKEAKPPGFEDVKHVISELNKELPEGILSLEFYIQDSLPIIRIDSENHEALDALWKKLNLELSLNGFKLGKHIAMGFHENQQADGYYVQKIGDKEDKGTSRWGSSTE